MHTASDILPSRIFRLAAIYGVIVLLPLLFVETCYGLDNPPAVTHPEFYYGFTTSALAWQVVFWIIGSDPVRFRPLMPAAAIEKFVWGLVAFGLPLAGRPVPVSIQVFAVIDTLLGIAFLYAWSKTGASQRTGAVANAR